MVAFSSLMKTTRVLRVRIRKRGHTSGWKNVSFLVQTIVTAQSNFILSYALLFRKGIKRLEFNLDKFFHDIHFFFKHSCARREHCASVEEVTEMAARYAMQYTETRWLTMKYVAVRILQQWKNLKGYSISWNFYPRKIISNLQWQMRIVVRGYVQHCRKH